MGLQLDKRIFYKESLVYLFTLLLINIFLHDGIITIGELIILFCLAPIYLYVGYAYSNNSSNASKPSKYAKEKDDDADSPNHKSGRCETDLEQEIYTSTETM